MTELEALLDFAVAQAKSAGAVMLDYFSRNDKGVQLKSNKTTVTEADKLINQKLIDAVAIRFPEHGVLGEEASDHADRNELWVCDPIDGTDAFILGVPTAMFSLAYVVDGTPAVAVLYDPFMQRLFNAVKGRGAYLNGEQVKVSQTAEMSSANVLAAGSLQQCFEREDFYKMLIDKGAKPRSVPGCVFKSSLVAQGCAEAHVFPGRSAHDVAATKLIVEEADGRVTDLDGNDQRYDRQIRGAIISNGTLHDELVLAMRQFGSEEFLGY